MEFYLHYRDGEVVGYSNCLNIGDDFECVQVDEQTYLNHLNKEKQKSLLVEEIGELNDWFIDYDIQIAQYNRCQRLGFIFDGDIEKLDNEAQQKQLRIREIREQLKTK